MMERKECVEIDQAQLFQQFNLQADRDRHDLIFFPGPTISSVATQARVWTSIVFYQGLEICVKTNNFVAVPSTIQRRLCVGEQSLFAIWDMPIYS
jgi:hypothetical protein